MSGHRSRARYQRCAVDTAVLWIAACQLHPAREITVLRSCLRRHERHLNHAVAHEHTVDHERRTELLEMAHPVVHAHHQQSHLDYLTSPGNGSIGRSSPLRPFSAYLQSGMQAELRPVLRGHVADGSCHRSCLPLVELGLAAWPGAQRSDPLSQGGLAKLAHQLDEPRHSTALATLVKLRDIPHQRQSMPHLRKRLSRRAATGPPHRSRRACRSARWDAGL